MKTSSCKSKGRRAAKQVKEILLSCAAELQEDDIVVTPSGVTGPDLHLSPKAKNLYPFAIEVKNQEALNIWSSLTQAEGHVKEGELPILFFRRNRSNLYACMDAKQLINLIRNYGVE